MFLNLCRRFMTACQGYVFMFLEVISKGVRIQETGVRIIGKLTEFELEFHSEFWILDSGF